MIRIDLEKLGENKQDCQAIIKESCCEVNTLGLCIDFICLTKAFLKIQGSVESYNGKKVHYESCIMFDGEVYCKKNGNTIDFCNQREVLAIVDKYIKGDK